ncbi:peptide transporter, partial [Francisella tularensis]
IVNTKFYSYLGYENLFMWITIVTVSAAFSLLVLKNKINNVIYK